MCPTCYSPVPPISLHNLPTVYNEDPAAILRDIMFVRMQLCILNARYNSTRPAVRLPHEILGHIFAFVRSESIDDNSPAADAFAHVCSRWRAVALSTPEIWRCINATRPPGYLRATLERMGNGDKPLTLLCHAPEVVRGGTLLTDLGPYSSSLGKRLYAMAAPQFSLSLGLPVVLQNPNIVRKLGVIDIHQPWSVHADIFRCLESGTPALTWAKISLVDSERHVSARPLSLNAPNLRVLFMENCVFNPTPSLCQSLRDLTLCGNLTHSPTILLANMARLENLRLQDVKWTSLNPLAPISLPSLRQFRVTESNVLIIRQLLTYLHFPPSVFTELVYRPDIGSQAEAASFVQTLQLWADQRNFAEARGMVELRLTDDAIELMLTSSSHEPLLRVLHDGRKPERLITAPNGQLAYPPAESLRLDPRYLPDAISSYNPFIVTIAPVELVLVDHAKWAMTNLNRLLDDFQHSPRVVYQAPKMQPGAQHPPAVMRATLGWHWPVSRVREVVLEGARMDDAMSKHLCEYFEQKSTPSIRIERCSSMTERLVDALRAGGRAVVWDGQNI